MAWAGGRGGSHGRVLLTLAPFSQSFGGVPKDWGVKRGTPIFLSSEPNIEVWRVWECGGEPGNFVLSGRKIDPESVWGCLILHIGCWVSGRMLCCVLVLNCDFLRPEQGWLCWDAEGPLGCVP